MERSLMFFLSRIEEKDVFIDIPQPDFNSIVFHIIKHSKLSRKKDIFNAIVDREQLGTTAIEKNIAIPHCRLKDFKGFYVKFALFREKPGYTAQKGAEVRFMFLIVGSEDDTGFYLRALAHIAKIMQIDDLRKELLKAKDRKDVCNIFRKYENKQLEKTYAWK